MINGNQPLLFFIAGIMQGSRVELTLHDQSYRVRLAELLRAHFPDCRVYDPFANHTDSIAYDDEQGRQTFLMHNRMCSTEADVVIAFIPEASMGTAIEIWEAYKKGAKVISISPLHLNWAVKFLSTTIYPNIESFFAAMQSGEIETLING